MKKDREKNIRAGRLGRSVLRPYKFWVRKNGWWRELGATF